MNRTSFEKQANMVSKRLGNYECEGQMSIFDVDWDSMSNKEKEQKNQREIDEMEPDFPF